MLLTTTTVISEAMGNGFGTVSTEPLQGGPQNPNWTVASNGSAFGTAPAFNQNQYATNGGGDLVITTGGGNQANAAWYNTPVPFQNFTAQFNYQNSAATIPAADGFTFGFQNDPRSTAQGQGLSTVLGGAGGSLGYSGITPSYAVQFNIYQGSHIGANSNGNVSDSTGTANVHLDNGNLFTIQLSYNSTKNSLSEQITDTQTHAVYQQTFNNVNLGTILTKGTAFLGFTGGTGGAWAQQDITAFTFSTSTTPPVQVGAIVGFGQVPSPGQNPSPFTLNGANGAGIDGSSPADNNHSTSPTISADDNTLTLTTAATNQASSAFYSAQGIYQNFTSAFTYQESGGTSTPGSGFTFTLENDSRGANALGKGGASLGYGTDGTATSIANSVAVEFNLGSTSTIAIAQNGAAGSSVTTTTPNVNLNSGDKIDVTIAYNSSTLTVTLKDETTSQTFTQAFNNLNLPTILGTNLAYVGFTGSTGTATDAQQTISAFSYTPNSSANPLPLVIPPALTGFSGSTTNGVTLNGADGNGLNGSAPNNRNQAGAPSINSNGNTLTLTNQGVGEASSAFFNTPVSTQDFTVSFTYQESGGSNPPANGFAFVLQSDQRGVNAIGGGATDLGYGSDGNNPAAAISGSFAAEFSNFNGSNGTSQVGVGTNGGINFPTIPVNTGAVNLASGHQIQVTLTYNQPSGVVYETLKDLTTNALFSIGYSVNVAGTVGANAFVGFTGSTNNDNYAIQTISNFSYSSSATVPAIPALVAAPVNSVSNFGNVWLNGNNAAPAGIPGVSADNKTLTITTQNGSEANTAFINTPVTYGNFNASFQYQMTGGGPADGFAFTLQDTPLLGGGGGSIGIGAQNPNSFAVEFNIYQNGSITLSGGGAVPTIHGFQNTGSVSLTSGHPINVGLAYNATAQTLTETLTDTTTSATFTGTYNNVDLSRILGYNGPTSGAYVGFTGGTGGANALQTITNFTYTASAPAAANAGPQVPLEGDFNAYGIDPQGSGIVNGGLDGGNALDSQFFTTNGGTTWSRQVTLNGATQTFNFGAPAGASTGFAPNSISASGQTINLPHGNYATLSFLGQAVNGAQNNQKFTVIYTDGTTQTFTQSFSDWFSGTTATGEQVAFTMSDRLNGNGAVENQGASIHVYEYNFTGLNTSKQLASLVLPNDGNVKIEAINLIAPPTVTAVSPNSGPATGGTSVTITGSGFTTATGVKFGTVAATNVTVVDDSHITATAPAGTGVVDVTVTNVVGTSPTTAADKYSYVPVVSGISPTSGPPAGGTTVTITGNGFTGATGVKFGTVAGTSVSVVDDSHITVVSPAGTGTVDVTVTGPGGTSATSAADQFTYTSNVNVTGVVVNGNNSALAGAQRSMVSSIVYTFSGAVILDPTSAFSIAVHAGEPGTAPTLAWAAINPDASGGSTQWVVTFSGTGTVGGSIGDGVYDITLDSTKATVEGNPTATVATRPTDTFYRLYGDITGDGRVNNADYNQFLNAFNTKPGQPGYNAGFDASGTGSRINNADYNLFLNNFNVRYTGFTATI